MLRRVAFQTNKEEQTSTETHKLMLHNEQYLAEYNGKILDLTPVEFKLVSILSSHSGHVYSRQYLVDYIYSDGRIVTDRTIDTHIKNIRKKLIDVGADEALIRSIYGIGYKWV
jgi:two-component system response regulator BaeR